MLNSQSIEENGQWKLIKEPEIQSITHGHFQGLCPKGVNLKISMQVIKTKIIGALKCN